MSIMKISYVFFGSESPFSILVMNELEAAGFIPTLIITDASKKISLKELQEKAPAGGWDVFIVASYGQIIPEAILNLPKHGSLNVHPSLLPKYRGPSPLQSAILADDSTTGVSIMLMDKDVDHGPLIAQEKVTVSAWPPSYQKMEIKLGGIGGNILAKILPEWLAGKIPAEPQNHALATFTKKITKNDGELAFDPAKKFLAGDPYQNFLKIQAFSHWPKAHFFIERKGRRQRIIITEVDYSDEKRTFLIERVIPEGKQEMNWPDFAKGYL